MINPVAPFYEFWLQFFTGLPLPFVTYFYLVWGVIIAFSIIRLAFTAR